MGDAVLPHPPWREQPRLLRTLLRDPQPVLDELAARFGPVCGFGAGPMKLAVVGDPVALEELFATPTDSFRWGHRFNVLGVVVGPGSMIVSDGPDHRRRRGAVQGAFSRRRLGGWIPMIVERTDAAVDRLAPALAGGRTVDLYDVSRSLLLEIVVHAFFGERLAARAAEIGALFRRPQDYLESPAVRQLPHPFPRTRRARVRADRRSLDAIIDGEIADRRRVPPPDRPDLVDRADVITALVADGTLSDAEIRDQVVTLIGAGYDTTAASLAWMLWSTALHPQWWQAMRDEADAVLGRPGSSAVADDAALAELAVARDVMRETLRLHPAGALSPREAVTEVSVGGYRIPRGTLILWSAHLAGRDPASWVDPLRFDPGRWADPTPEQEALADAAWVPFGRGRRNCIGFALAQMELTLVIARLAQRLDVSTAATSLPRPVGMVVNRPTGGVPMQVSLRTG